MTQLHRFDVWVIVREGDVVTQYLSEREAIQYVKSRNQRHGSRGFQTVSGTAVLEFALPDSDVDELPPQ